jgi:hypothetical protein
MADVDSFVSKSAALSAPAGVLARQRALGCCDASHLPRRRACHGTTTS